VSHVLKLIDAELRVAMALTGTTHVADIGKDILDQ
jgi:isopentenyl diphosphate isomerase/L-lactate dehydrogenase-like FMN-dependent dehydrogenase